MTSARPIYRHRCAVAIRAITGHDAHCCTRFEADNPETFTDTRAEPSIGRADRRGCIDMLSRRPLAPERGAGRPSVEDPANRITPSITRRIATETLRERDRLGDRALDLLDRYGQVGPMPDPADPALARGSRRG